jgi:NTP pyrophosphatase (non-canonical NTP hydrolase)
MNFNEYKKLAMRTNDSKDAERLEKKLESQNIDINIPELINGCLSLSGETGELNDMIKKWIFQGHDLDISEIEKELGDILWYVVLVCNAINLDLDKVANANVEKLKKRYPEGFSEYASTNRSEYKIEGLSDIVAYQEQMKKETD